jgi:transcription antitermination factor NusG
METTGIPDNYWYAIYVRPRHEFQVFGRLAKTGVEAFLPTVERLSKWKDRKKLIEFPLFPGYLFVHINKDSKDRLAILKTKGVVRFLGVSPNKPATIPDEQIDSLKRLVESKEALEPYPYLKEGERVRIKGGPLAGIEGMLVKKIRQHLLILSVDVLQQGVSLEIDASDVEKI